MSKDLCPVCGKLVWVTQEYRVTKGGQAYHLKCEIPEQRAEPIEDRAAPLPNERT